MQSNGVDVITKEYLKMAETFNDTSQEYIEQLLYSGLMSKDSCELMAHAVSSHDELAAEVERLRGELCVASNALDEVDRVLSERIKNGAYDLDDISAEVSQAIERLNRNIGLLMLT